MRSVAAAMGSIRGLGLALLVPGTVAWCAPAEDETDEQREAAEAETERQRREAEGEGEPGEGDLPDAVKAVLHKEREDRRKAEKDARDAARERDALKAEKAEREAAEMTELEREKARADAAEAAAAAANERVRETTVRAAVMAAATAANAHNPTLVYRLIPVADVEMDEDGSPTNAEALVAAVLEEHPYLVKAPEGDPPRQPIPATATRDDKRDVTDAEKEAGRRRDANRIRHAM